MTLNFALLAPVPHAGIMYTTAPTYEGQGWNPGICACSTSRPILAFCSFLKQGLFVALDIFKFTDICLPLHPKSAGIEGECHYAQELLSCFFFILFLLPLCLSASLSCISCILSLLSACMYVPYAICGGQKILELEFYMDGCEPSLFRCWELNLVPLNH